jgi:hypothetical protein
LGLAWTKELYAQFILTAKSMLRNQGSLSFNPARSGLHGFASVFLSAASAAIENKTTLVLPQENIEIKSQSPEIFEMTTVTLMWIIWRIGLSVRYTIE